jgi:hypothetical protein
MDASSMSPKAPAKTNIANQQQHHHLAILHEKRKFACQQKYPFLSSFIARIIQFNYLATQHEFIEMRKRLVSLKFIKHLYHRRAFLVQQ